MKKLNLTGAFKKIAACGLAVALLITATLPGQWNSGSNLPKNPPSVEINNEKPTKDKPVQD